MQEPRPPENRVLSVWELTRSIRSLLESEVGTVWVEGEISNFRRQSSGHQYFTLKDARSQLPCVLFRSLEDPHTGPDLADGLHVQVCGEVTVYELRGQYQLIARIVQSKGLGALQARFEALKRKLLAEGLFDPARKQPLPRFPLAVGLVTSPTGAALQDMLHVLKRRAPWLRVFVYPVRVQGAGAALEIAQAVREFNRWARPAATPRRMAGPAVDLIVVARGGGSFEDLWEFNEEIVARAIAASELPVVSAVGHEIDFSIADFVADLRAPTPSAAAELIVPDTADLLRQLGAAAQFLDRRLLEYVERARERLGARAQAALLREPLRRVTEVRQQLDHAEDLLSRAVRTRLDSMRGQVEDRRCRLRVSEALAVLAWRDGELRSRQEKLQALLHRAIDRTRARASESQRLLQVLGPQATLERGYSITTDASGSIVRSVAKLMAGDRLLIRLQDGSIPAEVAR
jgi:exodeoxyribonuclease VII large subunit